MNEMIMRLSALSILCGTVMTVMPAGGCRKICNLLCTAAFISCLLSPLIEFDFEQYALESARLHETEAAFSQKAADTEDKLLRSVIERKYSEYILDKAMTLGISGLAVKLELRWDASGIWVPHSADFTGNWSLEQKTKLKTLIRDELGIPEERQHWNIDQH